MSYRTLLLPLLPLGFLISASFSAHAFEEACDWDPERRFQAVSALNEAIAADRRLSSWEFSGSSNIEDYHFRRVNELCVIPLFPSGPEPEIFGALFDHDSGKFLSVEVISGIFDDCTDEEGDAELIDILQSFTPTGLDATATVGQAISRFGKNGPGLISEISLVDGQWVRGGIAATPNAPPDGRFAATFLLVEDYEIPMACTTHIYGTWIFDDAHTLIEIQIERSHGPIAGW